MSLDENTETYTLESAGVGGGFGAGQGTQAVIDTALAAAEPAVLDDQGRFTAHIIPNNGSLTVVDREALEERFRWTPRRKTGTYSVHDADSFAAYFLKHSDQASEVWADVLTSTITGVLDAHQPDSSFDRDDGTIEFVGPRWEQHRVAYAARKTVEWAAWTSMDGKLYGQEEFAEFVESRSLDIVDPPSADVLELVQSFQATTAVEFRSSTLLSNGQRQFTYREQTDGQGANGSIEIPRELSLGIRPFEGSDAFRVTAMFRYRIQNGTLKLGIKLIRPEDIEREAFTSVVQSVQGQIADHIGTPILMGAAPRAGDSTVDSRPFHLAAIER